MCHYKDKGAQNTAPAQLTLTQHSADLIVKLQRRVAQLGAALTHRQAGYQPQNKQLINSADSQTLIVLVVMS
jgi:hypothetical protein